MIPYCENNGRIDLFNRAYFEHEFLPRRKSNNEPLWTCFPKDGELCYLIEMGDEQVAIYLRSSINSITMESELTGQDSFRVWLVEKDTPDQPLSISYMVTRKSGWQKRLYAKFSELRELRQRAGNCSHCGKPRPIRKVKKNGPNKNRIFASHCRKPGEWIWLT